MTVLSGFDSVTGERVWDPNNQPMQQAFWEDVHATKTWQRFVRDFGNTSENRTRVVDILTRLHANAEHHTTGQFVDALDTAMNAGELTPKPVEAPVVEPTPTPLRSDGTPMTNSQQRWSEYRQFSETHSMKECRERARVDRGYQSFINKNREREFETVGDGVLEQNPHLEPQAPPSQAALADQRLVRFASDYRKSPAAEIRKLKRLDSNPLGAVQFNKDEAECFRLGLL